MGFFFLFFFLLLNIGIFISGKKERHDWILLISSDGFLQWAVSQFEPLLKTQAVFFPLLNRTFFFGFPFPVNILMHKISTKMRANSILYAEAIWSFFIAVKMSSTIKAPVKSLWLIQFFCHFFPHLLCFHCAHFAHLCESRISFFFSLDQFSGELGVGFAEWLLKHLVCCKAWRLRQTCFIVLDL